MSELADTVCAEIDTAREELVELCGTLVAAPSVNPPGRTAEVADLVRDYLEAKGIITEILKADDEAPNVIASVRGGGARGRHVVVHAHLGTQEARRES